MICKKCRKDISENEKFCSNCGKKVGSILNIGGILAILCIIIPTILIFIYGIATIFPSDFDKTLDEKKLLDFFEIKNCNILNEQEITPNDKIKTYYKTSKNSCLYEMNYVASDDNKLKASLRKNFLNKLNQNNNVTDKLSNHSSSGYVVDMSDGDNYNILIANQKFVLYLSTDTDNKQDIQNLLLDLGLKSNDKNIIYIFSYIFYVVILIIFMISWWKLNEKMNRKGWVCLIPVYNILCLFEDVFGKKVYCLLLLLPFINFVLFLILIYKLGRVFGKKPSYGILMILFPYVFIPILAFDDSKYLGPVKNNNKKSK